MAMVDIWSAYGQDPWRTCPDEQAPAQMGQHMGQQAPQIPYFTKYLSDNGRKVFGAAARIKDFQGRPSFTFEDLASNLSVTYETVKSWHRTSGRSAKRWKRETGAQEPIRFDWIAYDDVAPGGGERTMYRLPEDVAEVIRDLPVFQG
jgi:hypothetical protein